MASETGPTVPASPAETGPATPASPASPSSPSSPTVPAAIAAAVSSVTAAAGRIRRWPESTPVSLHAWMCDCGEYGVAECQPDSQRALEEHLREAAHPGGEYYYGCQGQRSTIRVTTGEDGQFVRALTDR
jgi:hypothetical protein